MNVLDDPEIRSVEATMRCPYRLSFPSSPHLAAKLENIVIDPQFIKEQYHLLSRRFDHVIIEGSGGLLVPYSTNGLLVDIVQSLHIPILLVSENILGTINQSLLTIEAIQKRSIPFLGTILNQVHPENAQIAEDNPVAIGNFTSSPIIGSLPYSPNIDKLYQHLSYAADGLC